ncbi:hypothetical protein XENTR_v10016862 [Xenopus tropicalis]|nr:hypothetical protein XENTR_v10016862 [Xenopus tropicalis]
MSTFSQAFSYLGRKAVKFALFFRLWPIYSANFCKQYCFFLVLFWQGKCTNFPANNFFGTVPIKFTNIWAIKEFVILPIIFTKCWAIIESVILPIKVTDFFAVL